MVGRLTRCETSTEAQQQGLQRWMTILHESRLPLCGSRSCSAFLQGPVQTNGRRTLRGLFPLLLVLFLHCASSARCHREPFGVHRLRLRGFQQISITYRQHVAHTVVESTKVPGQVVALTCYRGLQFSSFYSGQGESPTRGSVETREDEYE